MHVHDSFSTVLNCSSNYVFIDFFGFPPVSYTRSRPNQQQSEPSFQPLGCNDAITGQSLKGLRSNALGWISGAFIYLLLTVSRSGGKGAAADWSPFSKGLNMWSNVKSVCQKKKRERREMKEKERNRKMQLLSPRLLGHALVFRMTQAGAPLSEHKIENKLL